MTRCIDTPLGSMLAAASDAGLERLDFANEDSTSPSASSHPILNQLAGELAAYFAGRRATFTVPLAPRGTDFQRQVWDSLLTIPAGQTRSYSQIARQIGRPEAVRAVGLANGDNPIAILIPCHRVIGADGSLTGYGGGLPRKDWLLRHEQRWRSDSLFAAAESAPAHIT